VNEDDEFYEQIIRNRLAEANVDSPHSGSALDMFEAALLRYVSMPRANLRTDVLNFWRENASQFPEMVDIVNIVLAAPGTQVSVERLFSQLKFILSELRERMSSDNLEMY